MLSYELSESILRICMNTAPGVYCISFVALEELCQVTGLDTTYVLYDKKPVLETRGMDFDSCGC